MKRLLEAIPRDGSYATQAPSLDMLWEKACSLGDVRVNDSFTTPQTVEIQFKSSSGSRIQARGSNPDIYTAFRLAIEEAERLRRAK